MTVFKQRNSEYDKISLKCRKGKKNKTCQPRISYPVNILFKQEDEIEDILEMNLR